MKSSLINVHNKSIIITNLGTVVEKVQYTENGQSNGNMHV